MMMSPKDFLCLKSKAIINDDLEPLITLILDADLKPGYDMTFESGYYIDRLPLDTLILYYKYRRIVIVSPRDMIVLTKIHRVSPTEVWILAKTIVLDNFPPVKNIVRADTPTSGWRVKQIEPKKCKLTFYSEIDFKLPVWVQKKVGPYNGHLAQTIRNYVNKRNKKTK